MNFLKYKTVLITGGTGSLGSKIVERLIKSSIKKIKIYSRSELKQVEMKEKFNDERLRYLIGDVRDYERLYREMESVDIVIHCAALKHIDICEYNPIEAVKTNIDGSKNVIEAALNRKVSSVINISTDKAVNPISLYGATKLAAEKLFIDANVYSWGPKFSNVRFGNLGGSSGSVIPKFKKLYSEGKSLPVINPKMTRFYTTMDEAIDLILIALERMQGGEIYIPNSPSFLMQDLIDIYGGVSHSIPARPYEKIDEEMCTEYDNRIIREGYFVIKPQLKWYKNSELDNAPMINKYWNSRNQTLIKKEQLKELIEVLE